MKTPTTVIEVKCDICRQPVEQDETFHELKLGAAGSEIDAIYDVCMECWPQFLSVFRFLTGQVPLVQGLMLTYNSMVRVSGNDEAQRNLAILDYGANLFFTKGEI